MSNSVLIFVQPPPPPAARPASVVATFVQQHRPLVQQNRRSTSFVCRRRLTGGGGGEYHDAAEEVEVVIGFDDAVRLFNSGDYHRCHDAVEELWCSAEEPARTLLHGVLQCAVGFHHLFNQNHRGAMMELGEGVCKLRKLGFCEGPFALFEEEVTAVLEFVYQTQKELAACTEEFCLAMDGSESSYQLLGNFAAGQQVYSLGANTDGNSYIIFSAVNLYSSKGPLRIKVPMLSATEDDLRALQL